MTRTKALLAVPAALLIGLAGLIVTFEAGATSQMLRATPTAVATVKLGKALENLDQKRDAEAALERMRESILAEQKSWDEALTALNEQLADKITNKAPTEELQSLEEQIMFKQLDYQAWLQFKSEQMDVERSLMLRDLFRAIQLAIGEMADAEGYDIVISDDSAQEVTVDPNINASREMQVMRQLSNRRVIYRSDVSDITEDLVERMNNTYNAGGGR